MNKISLRTKKKKKKTYSEPACHAEVQPSGEITFSINVETNNTLA